MDVKHHERTTCKQKFSPKLIETEKLGFSVKIQQTALVQSCETK